MNRKADQSFGLSAIRPFVDNAHYKGYGDVASLYLQDSGYSFLYGVTFLTKPDGQNLENAQAIHLSFGDRFNTTVVLYCLVPDHGQPNLDDVLLVVLEDNTFQQFAFPVNPTVPVAPASPGEWGVINMMQFMSTHTDVNQEAALEPADFKRVGMLIMEHLKQFRQKIEYAHIFYPRGRTLIVPEVEDGKASDCEPEAEADDEKAGGRLGASKPQEQNKKGTSTKKEVARLLAEATKAYDFAPCTPRKRGSSVKFDNLDELEADPKKDSLIVNTKRPIIVDMTTVMGSGTGDRKSKKAVKTVEHKEAEAQAKEYKKLFQDAEKAAKKAATDLKLLQAKAASDTATAAKTVTAAGTAIAKKDNVVAQIALPPASLVSANRDDLRVHADADLLYETRRDDHVFTLVERVAKLA